MTDTAERVHDLLEEHGQIRAALNNLGQLVAAFHNHARPDEALDLRHRSRDPRARLQLIARSLELLSMAVSAHFYHEEQMLPVLQKKAPRTLGVSFQERLTEHLILKARLSATGSLIEVLSVNKPAQADWSDQVEALRAQMTSLGEVFAGHQAGEEMVFKKVLKKLET